MRLWHAKSSGCIALLFVFLVTGCASQEKEANDAYPTWEGTPLEYMEAVADCLRDAGWEAEVTPRPPSVESDYPASQREAFIRDDRACTKKLGRGPVPPPITRERAESRYEYHVKMRGCLSEHGYETSEPPSKEQFVNTALSGRPPWNPYMDVPADLRQEEWDSLIADCPQDLPLDE